MGNGELDWFLLGLFGYPLVALYFYVLLTAGAVCAGMNIWGIVRGKKTAGPGQKQETDGGAPAER